MARRVAIIAGEGALVGEVIAVARAAGDEVVVLPLVARPDLGAARVYGAADLRQLMADILAFGATHVTMVGGLKARAADRAALAQLGGGADGGDSALLGMAEKLLAAAGARVVGAEDIAPAILAEAGPIAGPPLAAPLLPAAQHALKIARAIGVLDIGQAAVVAGLRVIAVEDIAGTDALLARVAGYRAAFGLDLPLVLGKTLKPGQSRLVDRPAIGPATIEGAARAGVVAVVVEAGGAVVIDRTGLRAAADKAGIAVIGLALDAG